MQRALAGVSLAAACFLYLPDAAANGRFPRAGQIAVNPSDPEHIVARATFGLLTTRNGGERWDWICEYAVGYATGSVEDPAIAVTKDGTIVTALLEGLSVSGVDSCTFSFAGGGLEDRVMSDLSLEPSNPAGVVALVSEGLGSGNFLTQVWQSADNGRTWAEAGAALPAEVLGLTLDVAPSDAERIYVVGTSSSNNLGALARSDDRGQSWEILATASGATGVPYLSAIDPNDPDLVYVRVDDDPTDSLLVSTDAGVTWVTAFESQGDLLGFALSPDGSTVAIGGPEDGILTAPADTLTFERVSDVGARCLTWTDRGLFACADEVDGFEVGFSDDAGKSFTPVMHLQEICGALACSDDTIVGRECGGYWPVISNLILAPGCAPPATAQTSAGTPETSGTSSSCACRIGAPARSQPLAFTLLAVSTALVRMRRQRGRSARAIDARQ